MIITKINPQMRTRISIPGGPFRNAKAFPIGGNRYDEREAAFENRRYIIEQTTSWLRQRRVNNPALEFEILALLISLEDIRFRGLYHICEWITRKRINFQRIAPGQSNRGYNYYCQSIIPILEFCTRESIKANNQA